MPEAPAVKLGVRHVTVLPDRVQVPTVELTEINETPAGIASVIATPVAIVELLFLIPIV